MGELNTVGIKEIKNNLSAYLREVRRGIRVLVADRNRVVAELHEPTSAYAAHGSIDPTLTETERALVRAETGGALKGGDAQRLRGLLNRAQAAWTRMAVSENVLARASRPFPVEPVRTLDAIHLATALEFAAAYPDLRMLSVDRRLRENAEALGLA
jgi:antitoxin (DNA-binding transcriptional repressor) of toxin-antitoxin stability system